MEEVIVENKLIQSNQTSAVISQLESTVKQQQQQQQSSSLESDEVISSGARELSKSSGGGGDNNIPVLVPLQVPKAFKYPERYRSPTDAMVSPITRGLMGRKRRGGGEGAPLPLPPIGTNLPQKLQAAD
ncbi:unnamed protein product [Linum tenue]|uniref:Uncharacterized protein n=1 Tax=Linum tenue TaxID=586396 RepID=A0AAV0HPB5_9ROSI|nr:unnamed protein product [Linum tenue]